ncbi:hypothetical protein FOC4_g10012865 [Fusarium odoratissimum]|uniref:Uncharacterized protein n=1 Tax=Fusarium oxysporum f. sp. cubense (strain race 4) TaxID=2502994 RepID=N1RP92_FUSC4|nr:hypothetical protein FOC4_g10012865 [Fusarium odoratissimum]
MEEIVIMIDTCGSTKFRWSHVSCCVAFAGTFRPGFVFLDAREGTGSSATSWAFVFRGRYVANSAKRC